MRGRALSCFARVSTHPSEDGRSRFAWPTTRRSPSFPPLPPGFRFSINPFFYRAALRQAQGGFSFCPDPSVGVCDIILTMAINKKFLWAASRVVLVVYVFFGLHLYFNQRYFLYFPQIGEPQACEEFKNTGAEKLQKGETTLYYKQNGQTLLVLYHGNGGTTCDRKFLADFFNQLNISYLFVEYAGFGDNRDSTKEALEQNVRDAEDFVKELSFGKFVITGESLGTGLASYHATMRYPEAMIFISPYTSIAEVAASHYRVYPASAMVKDNYRVDFGNTNFAGKLLVIHGRQDKTIPFKFGQKVFNEAPFAQKESLFLENAGHNDIFHSSVVFDKLTEFLAESQ